MNYWVRCEALGELRWVVPLFQIEGWNCAWLPSSLLLVFVPWLDELFFIYSFKKKQEHTKHPSAQSIEKLN